MPDCLIAYIKKEVQKLQFFINRKILIYDYENLFGHLVIWSFTFSFFFWRVAYD